jgi:2-methylcitrate dehydratase PrpD
LLPGRRGYLHEKVARPNSVRLRLSALAFQLFNGRPNIGAKTSQLGRWLALRSPIIEVLYQARLDTLGVEIRGATLPWILPVYQHIRTMDGKGEATVSYYGDRLPAPYSAYANSTFSYACELQHHGSPGSAHSGVIVVPTVQALGEKSGSSGRDIIVAMTAGYEVQGCLGAALFNAAFKRHFHPQGVLGVVRR